MARNSTNYGAFVPTTQVWDTTEIQNIDVTKPEFKELLVRLYQNLNTMALNLNIKESAFYTDQEFVTGQQFPPSSVDSKSQSSINQRQSYRKMINFGALPNSATKTVAHDININTGFSFTRIYGTSSDKTGLIFIPLPYSSSVLANNIELWVDSTNVNISTSADYSAYTVTYIVLEYLKS